VQTDSKHVVVSFSAWWYCFHVTSCFSACDEDWYEL